MGTDIEVIDRFAAARGDRELARRAAHAARVFAGTPDLAVTVLLTDDDEIARLHDIHLGEASATDVMAFPVDDGVEVVVSVECAERQANAYANTREAELALYVVHGVLHACGFDDTTTHARTRMREAERSVLASLGVQTARNE